MSKSLINILNDKNAFDALLDELQGDISDEQIETTLQCWAEDITQQMAVKVDNYHSTMAFWDAASTYFRDEAKKFQQAAKTLDNLNDSLKDRLKATMIANNKFELTGNKRKYNLIKSPPSMVIDTNANIPTKYYTERITLELDKEQLKNDLKNGLEIDGVRLEYGFTLKSGVKK